MTTPKSVGNDGDTAESDDIVEIVTALNSFNGLGENQLRFEEGDEIKILNKNTEDWWWAELDGCYGYVPVNHVVSHSDRQAEKLRWQDEEYFGNYASLKLHQEMLADQPRTLAYKAAIEQNKDFIKGKVVLDVGCGTGILSMFCADYGKAVKVYGLEASEVAAHARKLVAHNGFANVIEIIEGQVETTELPQQVDLIISEWMGTLLLFELMIESVLIARDRWLTPGGVIWPSHSQLYLVPCSASALYNKTVGFWDTQYGYDFSCLREDAVEEYFHKPIFNHELQPSDQLSVATCILVLDMATVQVSDLEEIQNLFEFHITRDGMFHGLCSWFSVDFGGIPEEAKDPITLDTGPEHELTHWKQDLFMMDKPVEVFKGDVISGNMHIKRNPQWRRHLRVNFTYTITTETGSVTEFEKQFLLWR